MQQHLTTHATEHIYLQLNKPWYSRADTIWFKLYAVKDNHRLSNISGTAYAELISPKDTIIQRLNLKLESGMAAGDFALPITLLPGTYRIRAYTNWMKNQGEDSFYNRQIVIGNPNGYIATGISTKKTTIATVKSAIADIQFFPEGGELVSGLRNVIAFEAINPNGSAATVKGAVSETGGAIVAELESGHEGMGLFAFTPQPGKSYTASVIFNGTATQTFTLPKAIDEGYTLTVNNRDKDTISIKIAASNVLLSEPGQGFYLIAQAGGHICYTTSASLTEAVNTIKIAKSRFPSGVARFTLFRQNGDPVNERVAFIQQPDNIDLTIKADKDIYSATDKVSITLSEGIAGDKSTVSAFSAAVINEDKVPFDEAAEPSIFTQLLLNPEVHGNIHNPSYYLKGQTANTLADLDLLMLTQGYRRLDWKKLTDTTRQTPQYTAEDGLTISGMVKTTDSQKPVISGKVSLFSAQQMLKIDTLTDSKGRFHIDGLDMDGKPRIILKAFNGKSNNVNITLDPSDQTVPLPPYFLAQDTVAAVITAALKQSYADEQRRYMKVKGTMLKEVTIQNKAIIKPQDISSSANLHGGGHADQVVYGKDMINKGCPIVAQCLASMLHFVSVDLSQNDPAVYDISRGPRKNMVVYIDGAIGSLSSVTPETIYSIEALTSLASKSIYGTDGSNGILLVTTKHGIPDNEIEPIEKAPGILTYPFNGYYKSRTFYVPKFDANNITEQPSAIYWKPDILTDKDGKATIDFSNAGKGNYRVLIEGIDANGRLGRAVYKYKVE